MFSQKNHKYLDSKPVSETLRELGEKDQNGETKVSQIMEEFHENGILLSMIFFALPVAVPLPYPPGFTTIMGLPLMILSVQMILGSKQIKLPTKINNYTIKNSTLKKVSDKSVPLIKSVEKYIKPRYGFAKSVYCEQIVGIVSFLAAVAVAVPLPLTSAMPAQGITIISLGFLNRDGLVIVAGISVAIFGTIVAFFATAASWYIVVYLFHKVF